MNPQLSRKEEIEKGCGCPFIKKLKIGTDTETWDEKEYELFCPDIKYGLCPTCQARLDERIRAEQDFLKELDNFDLVLFLTDLKDTTTNENIEFPKEIEILMNEYWKFIKSKLKSTIQKEKTK